jgi:hypothetical protein
VGELTRLVQLNACPDAMGELHLAIITKIARADTIGNHTVAHLDLREQRDGERRWGGD